jgi:hypothetical protein
VGVPEAVAEFVGDTVPDVSVGVGVGVTVTVFAVRVTVGVVTTTFGVTVTVTLGTGVVADVRLPVCEPNTVVPDAALPVTRSLTGRPATSSTPVSTANAAAKTTVAAMATRATGWLRDGAEDPAPAGCTAGRAGSQRALAGTTVRTRAPVRSSECAYNAVPATLSTLAIAAPTTVPFTPRNDPAIAAVVAASALAINWISESRSRGESFDGITLFHSPDVAALIPRNLTRLSMQHCRA